MNLGVTEKVKPLIAAVRANVPALRPDAGRRGVISDAEPMRNGNAVAGK